MLSSLDITKKQVLFILAQEQEIKEIRLKNSNLYLQSKEGKVEQMSIYRLLAVFVLGEFTISSKILRSLKEFGISIYFLKQNCQCWGCIEASAEGNYLVRAKQYTVSESVELDLAKNLVEQKIFNQQLLLKEKDSNLPDFRVTKSEIQTKLKQITDKKSLLGLEGVYAKSYFSAYFAPQEWRGRKPQVKADITNLLMDIGYTYLFNLICAYLKLFGFDVYKGVYHTLFFERKSLACDLMEPFRPLIDKQIKKAYNLQQIDYDDFTLKNGTYSLTWAKQAKYSKLFLELLVSQRTEIFDYIRDYYRYFMKPSKYKFPQFKIKT